MSDIQDIYEGLLLGPNNYYLFGRSLTYSSLKGVVKCVGWFNQTQSFLFDGQGVVYQGQDFY